MYSGISNLENYKYNPILIERYFYSLSFRRRFLAKFFEKYRVSKEEYDKWFITKFLPSPI